MNAKKDWDDCPYCYGVGELDHPCQECKGSGKITERNANGTLRINIDLTPDEAKAARLVVATRSVELLREANHCAAQGNAALADRLREEARPLIAITKKLEDLSRDR